MLWAKLRRECKNVIRGLHGWSLWCFNIPAICLHLHETKDFQNVQRGRWKHSRPLKLLQLWRKVVGFRWWKDKKAWGWMMSLAQYHKQNKTSTASFFLAFRPEYHHHYICEEEHKCSKINISHCLLFISQWSFVVAEARAAQKYKNLSSKTDLSSLFSTETTFWISGCRRGGDSSSNSRHRPAHRASCPMRAAFTTREESRLCRSSRLALRSKKRKGPITLERPAVG